MSLDTVLITGASSGIGRAIALRLSARHNLVLGGRDPVRLAGVRGDCADPARHHLWPCDLADVDALAADLAARLPAWGGAVHAFVHSAGLLRVQPFRMSDPATARELFAVNVFSAAEITRLLTRRTLNGAALSRVLLVSSGAGLTGDKGNALYASSKAALHGLARSLAAEFTPAVRVNALAPGLVRTALSAEAVRRVESGPPAPGRYPLGVGEPADIAAAAAHLLSDDARRITGQTWVVDGGTLASAGP